MCLALPLILVSCGANYRTANFLVTAEKAADAKRIALHAEQLRRQLALDWFGYELPAWRNPCAIRVTVAENTTPRGLTSYDFRDGRPVAWQMRIAGSWEVLRQSVLPHEVTHTVFATHFARPLPRWAEEGVCVIVEGEGERLQLERTLTDRMRTGNIYGIERLLAMDKYPPDVHSFYSQGYSLVRFLVERGGRRKFVSFLDESLEGVDWSTTTRKHYGFESLASLQTAWLQWVRSSGDVILTSR